MLIMWGVHNDQPQLDLADHALHAAGAADVPAVVLERVVDARVHGGHDHLDALRDVRTLGPYGWLAERAAHVTAG